MDLIYLWRLRGCLLFKFRLPGGLVIFNCTLGIGLLRRHFGVRGGILRVPTLYRKLAIALKSRRYCNMQESITKFLDLDIKN